jgi:hypothetical protein
MIRWLAMHRSLPSQPARAAAWALFFALLLGSAAGAADSPDPSSKPKSQSLDEVVISAQKFDRRTLDHVLIPHFVQSHGAPSPMIDQVARWRQGVCPKTTGLQPAYDEFVTRRVVTAAQAVGAPSQGSGKKCDVNIEIVFTPAPQDLLDHIAKAYPTLLGSARSPHDTTFRRAIQTWYLTGTRSMAGWNPPVSGLDTPPTPGGPNQILPSTPPHSTPGVTIDLPNGQGAAPSGLAGSHLGMSLRSEFLHVLVVIDARKVTGLSLGAVADYVAMVTLTRMSSLDSCSELPSIVDLLASGCADRAKPGSITVADTAFLKALYGSDLEMKLNLERGEIHDRMLAELGQR